MGDQSLIKDPPQYTCFMEQQNEVERPIMEAKFLAIA